MKDKPKLVWYCIPCKDHKLRKPGEKKVRCGTCDRRMKRRKLAKDGTVVTVRMGLVPTKEKEIESPIQQKGTAGERYKTFCREYEDMNHNQRRGYLRRVWKGMFSKEDYPSKETNWMVHLRIQYELAAHSIEEMEALPSARFSKNYEAAKRFDLEGFSTVLKEISKACVQSELRKEEES